MGKKTRYRRERKKRKKENKKEGSKKDSQKNAYAHAPKIRADFSHCHATSSWRKRGPKKKVGKETEVLSLLIFRISRLKF